MAENNSSKNGLIIVLILLLLLVTGLYTYQYFKTVEQDATLTKLANENKDILSEKDSIQQDFQKLLNDFNDIKTDNEGLQTEINSQKAQIEEYIQKIKGLSKNSKELAYYKNKIKEIELSRDTYISQIDSLTNANKLLTAENSAIKTDIEKKNAENNQLSSKVSKGEKIKGANITATSFNKKGKPLNKAKRVTEIKLCITLVENEIARSGQRDVYFRIIDISGAVLHNSTQDLFNLNGQQIGYSAKTSVKYDNNTVQVCSSFNCTESTLKPGTYDVEAFTDGEKLGSTQITLE